jgi:hypothetical protein
MGTLKHFRYLRNALVAVSALLVSAFVWRAQTLRVPPPQPDSPPATRTRLSTAGPQAPPGPPSPRIPKPTPSAFDYKEAFTEAHDYWDYAQRVLPAAKAGNADAQFYLSRVLERCDYDNRMYFQRRGQRLTLDEGLQLAVKRHLSIEVAQSVFERCHPFQEHDSADLGSPAEWLAKATAAGQPLAEATTALKLLAQTALQDLASTNGVPYVGTAPASSDPRALLRAAVVSGEPEVLFSIGDAQGLLDPMNSDARSDRLAWFLVACQRGLDCSENADWIKNGCGDNAECRFASDSEDQVRKLAGDRWPTVQQRALEISAKLNSAQWDDLGLGSVAALSSRK